MLNIQNLSIEFHNAGNVKRVLDNFSMHIKEGEILGIAGESGSGKTISVYAIEGILPEDAVIASGEIIYNGINILHLDKKKRRDLHGKEFGMVFQDPLTSLNPLLKVGVQVEENLLLHTDFTKEQRKQRALQMLEAVELRDVEKVYDSYPHELSGGMRQRVMLAAALIHSPKILIADEPTTALDVIAQAKLIALIKRMNKELNVAIIFISHNLLVLNRLCDRVIVMKKGVIVESGDVKEIFEHPHHEYTKELIYAFKR